MSATDISGYVKTETEIIDGMLYRDGKPLHDKKSIGKVKVTLSEPDIFGARSLQGLLTKVELSSSGFYVLTFHERQVKDGKYDKDGCCRDPLIVTTRTLGGNFLQVGWTNDQGNTTGITSVPSFC